MWLVWSPCCPQDSQEFSSAAQFESMNSLLLSLPYGPTLRSVYDYWKNHNFDHKDPCWGKVISLLFNMLSRFVIAFFPKSKNLLISLLQSLSTVILEPKKIKSATVSIFFPIYLPWSNGIRCHDLCFWKLSLSQLFFTLLFHLKWNRQNCCWVGKKTHQT